MLRKLARHEPSSKTRPILTCVVTDTGPRRGQVDHPGFDGLRSDPQFQSLIRRLNLAE